MSQSQVVGSLTKSLRGVLAAAACIIPLSGHATMFTFGPLCDASGCGTADLDITISGNTLTAVLDNTSPTTLEDGTGTNTPGITAFGFNVADPLPTIDSWSLTAYDVNGGGLVVIDDQTGTGDWVMSTTQAGVTLDFLPSTDSANVQGALYNPAATTGYGATPNYETGATLVINFLSAPVLAADPCGSGLGDCTTYVRMQNVGLDGKGSLKLPGSDGGGSEPPGSVPEPSTLALLSMGMLGGAAFRRRQRGKKS